uniref:RPA43 OB domain-containing protein n=2 Tax=Lutzomyia longipalpis TaxID=7200 RepID=A0A1B0GLB8_LUTLO
MKKIKSYVQFTKAELENYTRDESSCVERMNNTIHIDFPPWGMNNFQDSLISSVATKKIGNFDATLNGIVLDVKNIKLQGDMNLVRYDAPELHLTIQADFYLFKPRTDAILRGIVNHVSRDHISVVIYRVFNVSIKLSQAHGRHRLKIGDEITFKVKKFDLQNILPYIEGDLMDRDSMDSGMSTSEERGEGSNIKYCTDSDWDTDKETTEQPPIAVKTENSKRSQDSSSSSDEEDDRKSLIRGIIEKQKIKQEPKTPPSTSPEKSLPDERSSVKKLKKRVTIAPAEDSKSDSDRHSVRKEAVGKKRTKKTIEAAKVPKVTTPGDSSTSDSDDDSISNLLVNRVKREKEQSNTSM